MRRAMLILALVAMAGCQTAVQSEMNAQSTLSANYVGRPLSDFIFATGLNPVDMFDMSGGERVFLFDVPCKSWWRTQKTGEGGTPAHFIVKAVEVRGYCR